MAELLLRGWNTAIPEVDVGDDIFVVHDRDGDLRRVQVKTALAKSLKKGGFWAQFNLPLSQLQGELDMTYIFTIRLRECWKDFVVISRQDLEDLRENEMGNENSGRLVLRLRFEKASITCGQHDLSQYRNDWDTHFPVIEH